MTIKIGDEVTASLFSGTLVTGKITDIEITKNENKYGISVNRCNLDRNPNGVVDLDCGHWVYFYQIKFVNDEQRK